MKRALIISYYWPPSGGSGVQRWLKFSKYLPQYGWQPVIYTPSNPEIPAVDNSLELDIPEIAEVIKRPIFEPYGLYKKIFGKHNATETEVNPIKNTGKQSCFQSLSLWIRANLFIPDPRIFWVDSSVKFLKEYLKDNPVDVIVSTGPPHSMHLIAKKVSKATRIKWVADFRDPWTRIFYFKHLPLTSRSLRRIQKMERSVITQADAVVAVTDKIRDEFKSIAGDNGARLTSFYTITNGYDQDDFIVKSATLEDDFTFTYTGVFSDEGNPLNFWTVLQELSSQDTSFANNLKIRLIGKTDKRILDSIHSAGLDKNLINMGYLPHSQIAEWQTKAHVLMMPIRNEPEAGGILTGKFFEYLAAARPIIAFGPKDGEMASVLNKTMSGNIFDWDEKESLKQMISQYYNHYLAMKKGEAKDISLRDEKAISMYSRINLTGKMVEIWEDLLMNK